MVTCPRMENTTVPESTCIARQKIIRKGERSYVYKNGAYYDCYYSCHGCRVGLALLRDSGQKTTKSEQYRQRLAQAAKRRVKMKQAEKIDKAEAAQGPGAELTEKSLSKKDFVKYDATMRKCSRCGNRLALTTENFKWCGRGYSLNCLTCLVNKKAYTGLTRPATPETEPAETKPAETEPENGPRLQIDVDRVPGLRVWLEKVADADMRPVDVQALYILKRIFLNNTAD